MSQIPALQKNKKYKNNIPTQSENPVHRVAFFDAHHRLDRIVLAIFALTQHMLGHEYGADLAMRIRNAGLDCLDVMRDITLPENNGMRTNRDVLYISVQHMASYIQIMSRTSLVSPKNATLLIGEIERFRDQLDTIPHAMLGSLFSQNLSHKKEKEKREGNIGPTSSGDLTEIFRQENAIDMYARIKNTSSPYIEGNREEDGREIAIAHDTQAMSFIKKEENKEIPQESKQPSRAKEETSLLASNAKSKEAVDTRSQGDMSRGILEKNAHESISSSPSTKTRENTPDTPKKAQRKSLILRELREKGQAQIGDVAAAIEGVSEKTIQRDLKELIAQGRVTREGTRRWAIYRASQT